MTTTGSTQPALRCSSSNRWQQQHVFSRLCCRFWRSFYDMPAQDFGPLVEALWLEVKPL